MAVRSSTENPKLISAEVLVAPSAGPFVIVMTGGVWSKTTDELSVVVEITKPALPARSVSAIEKGTAPSASPEGLVVEASKIFPVVVATVALQPTDGDGLGVSTAPRSRLKLET